MCRMRNNIHSMYYEQEKVQVLRHTIITKDFINDIEDYIT